ncbi:MAG: hypothetical protein WC804_01525 [Sphingomonas sp.]|jgi:hypothetical protein|uniref:hypothetical protein n=1 Tax=Sphingomonas sp. TaxID=28214 RepID=UPI00356539FC
MSEPFPPVARGLGLVSAALILPTALAYAVTLALGLASLTSPAQPIGDPYFTILELLILVLAPAMMSLMVAVHGWAPVRWRTFTLTAVCFMAMLAVVTCSVHFVIVTLGRQPGFVDNPALAPLIAFRWPSLAYALDILAWDVFFALAMLFAAPAFTGAGLRAAIRLAMRTSAVLALAGLAGVVSGNMAVRNIGIAGYLGVFLIVDALLLLLFLRADTASG